MSAGIDLEAMGLGALIFEEVSLVATDQGG